MIGYNYKIESAWWGPRKEPAEIGARFLQAIDALSRLNPIFTDWGVQIAPDSFEMQPIENVRPQFTHFVEANVRRDDWDQPDPDEGYFLLAASNFRTKSPADSISFGGTSGSTQRNYNRLEFGNRSHPPDPAAITYPLFKATLLTMLSIWPAFWANVRVSRWGHKPLAPEGEPPFPDSGYRMPWMAYLCAARAAHVDVPAGVLTERTQDGGLLMIAAETRFDPEDREHMARSRVLAEILIAHGGIPRAEVAVIPLHHAAHGPPPPLREGGIGSGAAMRRKGWAWLSI